MSRTSDQPEGLWPRRARALLAAFLLFLALPMNTVARGAAAPVTAGDFMRAIYVAPDRKIDASEKGVAVAPPPLPPSEMQSSSEPARPLEPTAATTEFPRFWLSRPPVRRRRVRRRQIPRRGSS